MVALGWILITLLILVVGGFIINEVLGYIDDCADSLFGPD